MSKNYFLSTQNNCKNQIKVVNLIDFERFNALKMYLYRVFRLAFVLSFVQGIHFSLLQAQYISILEDKWEGDWEGINGFVFDLKMDIRATSETQFEGAIEWTVVNYPASRRDYYGKRGKKAIEYIKGTAQGQSVYFKGYARKDPHNIIALDEYRLVLDCEKPSLTGITKHHGTWKATFFAVKMLESIKAADSLMYNVHYCNTLALNDAAYQNPQARAVYYEWARNFVQYKKINTHYFHLPEWDFSYQNQAKAIKAAEMGESQANVSSPAQFLKEDKALADFQEQLNRQVFRKRMETALAISTMQAATFEKASQEKQWIAEEQAATQNFLNQNTYFQAHKNALNQRIALLGQFSQTREFWAVIQDFDDKSARIKWQEMYLQKFE